MTPNGYVVFTVIVTVAAMLLLALIGYAVWRGYLRVRHFYREFIGLAGIFHTLGPALNGIWAELAALRMLLTPPDAEQQTPPPYVPIRGAEQRGPIQFPSIPRSFFDRDATMEDTPRELVEQTEEELAEQMHLEEMRERGMEVDDTPHPGVVANAE